MVYHLIDERSNYKLDQIETGLKNNLGLLTEEMCITTKLADTLWI